MTMVTGLKWVGTVLLAAAGIASISSGIALSSQDIVHWAASPGGLGLADGWALLAFIALDVAAAYCVGMTIVAAIRDEPPGAFRLVIWVAAGGSAVANLRYGLELRAAGKSADSWWFFPGMSLLGPLLLELSLHRIRRWVRVAEGRQRRAAAQFPAERWRGAFWETRAARRLSVTEGIADPDVAVTLARAWGLAQEEPPRWALRGAAVAAAMTTVAAGPVAIPYPDGDGDGPDRRAARADGAPPTSGDGDRSETQDRSACGCAPARSPEIDALVEKGRAFTRAYEQEHHVWPTNAEIGAHCDRSESWSRMYGILAAAKAEKAALAGAGAGVAG